MDADDCSHWSFLTLGAQISKSSIKIEDVRKLVK